MAGRKKPEKKMDKVYLPSIRALVDALYQEAFERHWNWAKLARESGLSLSTVQKLGRYQTRYPQYRTVELLAQALGGRVDFHTGGTARSRKNITWKPKVFDGRKKTEAA